MSLSEHVWFVLRRQPLRGELDRRVIKLLSSRQPHIARGRLEGIGTVEISN